MQHAITAQREAAAARRLFSCPGSLRIAGWMATGPPWKPGSPTTPLKGCDDKQSCCRRLSVQKHRWEHEYTHTHTAHIDEPLIPPLI